MHLLLLLLLLIYLFILLLVDGVGLGCEEMEPYLFLYKFDDMEAG